MFKSLLSIPSGFFTPDKKRLSLLAYFFLIALSVGFFTPGLATLPPTDRDESSFAQASKQMLETGNYADIRLQEDPRYKKPVGIYWLQAASVKIFNAGHLDEIWAYRLPSFFAAIAAVLLTAALGSLLFGPMTGLLAGIMMAGCVLLNAEARLAKTDATLLASIMAMQYALARAYLKKVKGWAMPLLFWTAVGIGILVKGPIILFVLLSTLSWIFVKENKIEWFGKLKPGYGIIYVALMTLPWLVIVGLATHGKFYQQSAGHDMFAKMWNGEFRGILPPGLHALIFPAMFFPFSIFALMAIPDTWKHRNEPAVRFCVAWIVPVWIVFELSLTKLPHYVLPIYPAIAILAARGLTSGWKSLSEHRWRWVPPLAIGAWLMAGTALALAPVLSGYLLNQKWNPWQIAASVVLLLIQGAAVFMLFQKNKNSVLLLAAAQMIFVACTFGSTLPNLQHVWLSKEVVQMADAAKPCDKLEIISATYNEPSLIFLAGTHTEFVPSGSLAAVGMWANPCLIAVTDNDHDEIFLSAFKNKAYHPISIGTVTGLNTGRGNSIDLRLYKLPPKAQKP